MATVEVDRSVPATVELPPVCVVSGEPAETTFELRSNSLPGWTWILSLFGILPFLIVVVFAGQRFTIDLPIRAERLDRYHRARRRSGVVALSAAVGGTVIGVWSGQILAVTSGLAIAFVAMVVSAVVGFRFPTATLRDEGRSVRLHRVHPRFAAAHDRAAVDAA